MRAALRASVLMRASTSAGTASPSIFRVTEAVPGRELGREVGRELLRRHTERCFVHPLQHVTLHAFKDVLHVLGDLCVGRGEATLGRRLS